MFEVRSVEELFSVLEAGRDLSDGESLDVLAHGLQCGAALAAAFPGDPELQVAGLVHDLGTILEPGCPATHAVTGAGAIRRLLGTRVAGFVAGHDQAKRYLVTVEADYRNCLSPRSRASLREQGGLLDPSERTSFERRSDVPALLALRRADDRAKVYGLEVPGLERWRDVVGALALSCAR